MPNTPIVAIVGRPNVGKSTLFNRLTGRRQAIVHDTPGVTRDRLSGRVELDDEVTIELVDTGGLVPEDDPLGLNQQVLLAVEESDLLLFVVDGRDGLVPSDESVWETLRRFDRPAVLVVNKGDTKAAQNGYDEFYQLGVWPLVLISAEHNTGVDELLGHVVELVAENPRPAVDVADDVPRLAIVGRPNVGKSSIVNRLLGSQRVLVSPQAGTTRDPIDSVLETEDGSRYVLVDTAGIRRRSQVADTPEDLAVMMARRQIERADLAVLVIDASAGVTSGDLGIAGAIWDGGRAVVVALNKWDLLDEDKRKELEEGWERLSEITRNPPRVNVSALSGRRLDRLLPQVEPALERFRLEVSTSELNRLLDQAVARHHAPTLRGKPWNLFYSTQVATGPPTFMLFANRTLERSDPYRRYLENFLRSQLDLDGVPIRLVIRERKRRS